jgi:hypothetical protein
MIYVIAILLFGLVFQDASKKKEEDTIDQAAQAFMNECKLKNKKCKCVYAQGDSTVVYQNYDVKVP